MNIELRSRASRFYRWSTRRWVRLAAVCGIFAGWTMVLLAQAGPPLLDGPVSPIAAAGGGALVFMGIFAGISRWVADPAARKALAEHTLLGAKAHPELIPRAEWEVHELRMTNQITNLRLDLRGLIAELRRGKGITANDTTLDSEESA